MTTTITEEGRASRLRRPIRSRNHEIRPAGSVHDLGGEAREGPKKGSPKTAFVSGAKAIALVALALVPLGLAFGATAMGSGLSTLEALGMSAFVLSGAATFALRLSFIALLGRIEVPPVLERALRNVPAAVLTAVVVPLLFYQDGALELSLGNERLLAGLIAVLIAWLTRNVLLVLGGGMAALWTLQALGQSL